MKKVKSSEEFFDILDKVGNGKFVTIGYVTSANLDVPTVSRRNPDTNRMKKYPDYSVFSDKNDIGALVKISSYNMRYEHRSTVGKKYGEWKGKVNAIRGQFGLEAMGDKSSYKQGTTWSPNGPELYKGNNDDLRSHSYNPQNIYGANINSRVYAVNGEGHIINELTPEQVKPYLKAKREEGGVAALRKMGAEEEKIKDYISQIENLKFRYVNFESNSILWMAATVDGDKIVYINDKLQRAVDGIDINPEDFIKIAKERYAEDIMNESKSMKKKVIKLSENAIKKMVAESVKRILKEYRMPNEPATDYEGNDLKYDNVFYDALNVIDEMGSNEIKWADVARRMGFRLETLNEDDMELLHDAIEDAMEYAQRTLN